jgi:hypothetical protein
VRDNNRGILLGVAIVAAVVIGLLVFVQPSGGRPLDPRSHEPDGTSALVALARELDVDVALDADSVDDLDEADVALVLRDGFDSDLRGDLRDWVEDGGTLVVIDPASSLAPFARFPGDFGDLGGDGGGDGDGEGDDDFGDPAPDQADGDRSDDDGDDVGTEEGGHDGKDGAFVAAGTCDIDALDDSDTDAISVLGGTVRYDVASGAESCFGNADEAYIVAEDQGAGTIVAIGGSGILLNATLDEADNAPVIAALIAPQPGRLVVFDPYLRAGGPAGDGEGLNDLISPGVKRALVQLGIAFLVYALWKARRLGRPVDEPQPVSVAGSELVSAVGGLLQRSGSPQHAADRLRDDLRRELVSRLGVPPNLPPPALVEVVANRTNIEAGRIGAALGPSPVSNDGELLAVAQLIDAVRKEVFDHVGS